MTTLQRSSPLPRPRRRPSTRRPPPLRARPSPLRSPRPRARALRRCCATLGWPASAALLLAATVLVLVIPLALPLRAQPLVLQVPLEPVRSAVLSCRTSGLLADLRVREGDTVAAGDTLACLDAALPQLRLQAAAADLEAARHRAQAARTLYAHQQLSRCDLEQLEAALRAAALRHAEAQSSAAATVLCAPFAGCLAEVLVQLGDYLTPEQLAAVRPGQRVRAAPLRPPDAPAGPLPASPPLFGTLTYVAPELDPQQGTATALVRFPGAGHRLRPGTLVTLTLAAD